MGYKYYSRKKPEPEERHVCARCGRRRNESTMKKTKVFGYWVCKSRWSSSDSWDCSVRTGSKANALIGIFKESRERITEIVGPAYMTTLISELSGDP